MVSVPAALVEAGVHVVEGDAHVVTYRDGDRAVTAEIWKFDELPVLSRSLHARSASRLLVACVSASANARKWALSRPDVDLIVETPREVILNGHVYVDDRRKVPGQSASASRQGAIERMLILADRRVAQHEMANALSMSQQGVSRIVSSRGWPATPLSPAERSELLDSWLDGYQPNYEEMYWYGLASITGQATAVVEYCRRELGVGAYVGGEVAADQIRPWRVPSTALVYCEELLDLTDVDLVPADADRATLTLRVSADPTVLSTSRWWWNEMDGKGATVDPVIALWDLHAMRSDLGDGAEKELHDWICRAGDHRLDIPR